MISKHGADDVLGDLRMADDILESFYSGLEIGTTADSEQHLRLLAHVAAMVQRERHREEDDR